MGQSVLSKEFMTLAARMGVVDASLVKTLRAVCLGISRRNNQATYAHLLGTQSLGDTALRGGPNLFAYPTPSSIAASARYKNLGLGTQALGTMLQVVRSQHGSSQLGTMESLYSLRYNGEGATPFVLQGQTLVRLARNNVPPLPKSLVGGPNTESHPGTSDLVGMQVVVLRLVKAKTDDPSKFSASEIAAIEELHQDWEDGKYSSFSDLLGWATRIEASGSLRPLQKGRGSGFHAGEISRDLHGGDSSRADGSASSEDIRDSVIGSGAYSHAIDIVARNLPLEIFSEYFDSVAQKGFRYRLKPLTGGRTLSSLKKHLGTDKNPPARDALTVLMKAIFPHWDKRPSCYVNEDLRRAQVVEFVHPSNCRPSNSSKSPSSQGQVGGIDRSSRRSRSRKPPKNKSGKAMVLLDGARTPSDEPRLEFMAAFEKGLVPLLSWLDTLEQRVKESDVSLSGSAHSAQGAGSSESMLDILTEIRASQAKQAKDQVDLQDELSSQRKFLRFRFEDYPGN